jgi:hypothetical protein
MNPWLLAAGTLAAVTAAIHIIAGHVVRVVPLLGSSLEVVPKRTLHAVWHMVSADLVLSAAALCYLGALEPDGHRLLAYFIAVLFVSYATVFLFIAMSIGWPHLLLRLPQWMLLLPIGVLSGLGAR